jgi:Ca2+-binding EF-hand superfamily protein
MAKILVGLIGLALSLSVAADHHKDRGKDSQAREFFKMADSDQDGKVSYAEHEAFIAMQADKGRKRFNSMDTNSDGYVTKEEAKEVRRKMKRKLKEMRKKVNYPEQNLFFTMDKSKNNIWEFYPNFPNNFPRTY